MQSQSSPPDEGDRYHQEWGQKCLIMFHCTHVMSYEASQVVLVVKNLPAYAGDTRDSLDWEDSPGEGNGNPL